MTGGEITSKVLESMKPECVTYSDLELSVVEEQSSVGADESILFFLSESRYSNLSHFSYLIII